MLRFFATASILSSMSTGMIAGFHDDEIGNELHRLGFEVLERLSSEEIQRRYFRGRSVDLTMLDHICFICARVVREERLALGL